MSPIFLILCLIMFWVFYQKGLKFFLALGHQKWRSHLEGALVGLLVGFVFPLGVIFYGAGKDQPKPAVTAAAPQVPGSTAGSAAPERVKIPE